MSVPISYCALVAAYDGDDRAVVSLGQALLPNLEAGHFSIAPCPHEPPCRMLTDEEFEDFTMRAERLLENLP